MRSVGIVLGACLLLTSCQAEPTITLVDGASGAVEMRLSSSTVILQVGQAAQLEATLLDRAGQQVAGTITWRTSADAVARVDRTGRLTGIAAGEATVFASYDTVSAQARVIVTDVVRPVASVSITLPPSQLQVGQSQALTVVARDETGAELTGRPVSWSSSNGTVATVGTDNVLTARAVGGTQITATVEGRSASFALTVVEAPPPSAWPNEPSGSTPLTERGFGAVGEDGWLQPLGRFSIATDSSAPRSPATVGQVTFPAGFAGGSEPARLEKNFDRRFSTVYLSFWIRLSPNWVGHPSSGVNKTMHLWVAGGNRLVLSAQGTGTGTLVPQIRLQGIASGDGTRNINPNLVPGAQIVRGRWQRWELVARTNTPGVANGVIEWWIDGVKVGSVADVPFVRSGESVTWELLQWAPTWGGIGNTVAADQFMWVDHLYASGR